MITEQQATEPKPAGPTGTATNRAEAYSPFAAATGATSAKAEADKGPPIVDGKLELPMFGGAYPASLFCDYLFKHIAASGEGYLRGGKVFQLATDSTRQVVLEPVTPASAVTWLEKYVTCYAP